MYTPKQQCIANFKIETFEVTRYRTETFHGNVHICISFCPNAGACRECSEGFPVCREDNHILELQRKLIPWTRKDAALFSL